MNKLCEGCDLLGERGCRAKLKPSTKDWFNSEYNTDKEFISVNRMCRKQSLFGNEWVGLTLNDIERLKNGEIIFIPGEYGTFIGITEEVKESSFQEDLEFFVNDCTKAQLKALYERVKEKLEKEATNE